MRAYILQVVQGIKPTILALQRSASTHHNRLYSMTVESNGQQQDGSTAVFHLLFVLRETLAAHTDCGLTYGGQWVQVHQFMGFSFQSTQLATLSPISK